MVYCSFRLPRLWHGAKIGTEKKNRTAIHIVSPSVSRSRHPCCLRTNHPNASPHRAQQRHPPPSHRICLGQHGAGLRYAPPAPPHRAHAAPLVVLFLLPSFSVCARVCVYIHACVTRTGNRPPLSSSFLPFQGRPGRPTRSRSTACWFASIFRPRRLGCWLPGRT